MSAKPAIAIAASRLPGLDGLRGIASLMVFAYHLRWHARASDTAPVSLPVAGFDLAPLLTRFDIGVAVFFVLSGLLLSLPFWNAILANAAPPDPRRYLWRRVCRILPAYYAVLIVVYLLREGTYLFHGLLDFALHATFLHNFADYTYFSSLGVLWTIGIEFQFYLILPLIMAALGWLWKIGGAWLALTALFIGTWALDLGAAALIRSIEPHVPDRFLAADGSILENGTIFAYLRLFAFGIAAALAVLRWKPGRFASDLICLAALAGLGVLAASGTEAGWAKTGGFAWPANVIVIGLLAAAVPHSRMFRQVLDSRPLIAAGTISYGIYLWHELVLRAVFGGTLRNNLDGWPLFLSGGALALLVTIVIAALSWFSIERRALRSPYPFQA